MLVANSLGAKKWSREGDAGGAGRAHPSLEASLFLVAEDVGNGFAEPVERLYLIHFAVC